MYSFIHTANIDHLCAREVKVEVAAYNGLPGIKITGLPDTVVKESMHRISTAFKTCGIEMPLKRFVINFVPADVPKKGSGFDLPIATAMLKAIGAIPNDSLNNCIVYGEVALTGEIKAVSGVLPVLNFAHKKFELAIIPGMNSHEACFFKDKTLPLNSIQELINFANTGEIPKTLEDISGSKNKNLESNKDLINKDNSSFNSDLKDFCDVIGQAIAVRAAQIAVAGRHHLLLIGSPGCGKSMIGERIPSIMPNLSRDEKLEVNSIYSIAGLLGNNIIHNPPYRAPHHTSTDAALIGGNRIGEISLAHKGVLFLDELSEFKYNVLNALREPLEKGYINISRSSYFHTMPADFLLIGASNPCNCGNILKRDGSCTCSSMSLERFKRRLNGPLMDRFDMKIVMMSPKIKIDQITEKALIEEQYTLSSKELKKQILESLNFKEELKKNNIKQKLNEAAKRIMDRHINSKNSSIRSIRKIINLSKTIACLELSENITEAHLLEALSYANSVFENT
jgi:magnesium chelatase family protein